MKIKRSKKRFDWTIKNLRRTRSKHRRDHYLENVKKKDRKLWNSSSKAYNKQSLYNELQGNESRVSYLEDRIYKREQIWYWN